MKFSNEAMRVANATLRSNGASVFDTDGGIRSIVALYVADKYREAREDYYILDYGCGKHAIQRAYLIEKCGFAHVDGHDFGNNQPICERFNYDYDVIYASNVINVAMSKTMVYNDFVEMKIHTTDGGTVIFNYPSSPRKAGLSNKEIMEIAMNVFGNIETIHYNGNTVYSCKVNKNYYVNTVWRIKEGFSSEEDDCYERISIVMSKEDGTTILETDDEEYAHSYC